MGTISDMLGITPGKGVDDDEVKRIRGGMDRIEGIFGQIADNNMTSVTCQFIDEIEKALWRGRNATTLEELRAALANGHAVPAPVAALGAGSTASSAPAVDPTRQPILNMFAANLPGLTAGQIVAIGHIMDGTVQVDPASGRMIALKDATDKVVALEHAVSSIGSPAGIGKTSGESTEDYAKRLAKELHDARAAANRVPTLESDLATATQGANAFTALLGAVETRAGKKPNKDEKAADYVNRIWPAATASSGDSDKLKSIKSKFDALSAAWQKAEKATAAFGGKIRYSFGQTQDDALVRAWEALKDEVNPTKSS